MGRSCLFTDAVITLATRVGGACLVTHQQQQQPMP